MPQGTRPVRCWPSLHGRAPGRRGSGAFSTGSSSRRGRARRWPRRATDRRTGPGPVPHPPPAGSHRPLRAAVCNSPTPRGRGHGSSSRPRPPARPWCRPPSRSPPRRRRPAPAPAPVSTGSGADASAPAPAPPTSPGSGDLISPSAVVIANTVATLNNTVTTTAGQLGRAIPTLDPATGAVRGVGATVRAFGRWSTAL